MESHRETQLRLAWMREHFKLGDKAPFAELQDITLRVQAESVTNRKAMLAEQPKGPLNFKYVDDLTARIQAKRDAKK